MSLLFPISIVGKANSKILDGRQYLHVYSFHQNILFGVQVKESHVKNK